MPFEQGLRLNNGNDIIQQFTEWFAFLSQSLTLGILKAPVGAMSVQERAIDAILLQHKFEFLAQRFVNLAG